MGEVTLESLARRVAELERRLARFEVKKQIEWLNERPLFREDDELVKQVNAEILAAREAERQAAREGRFNDDF